MCDTKQGQQLRSSLRKTHTSDQNGSKDADPDKHVRFACPKDSTFKCHSQFPSIKATSYWSNENAERMPPVQRKRNITLEGGCEQGNRIKKNRPNERIIRLSQTLETLLRSSKLKEIDRKIEESREDAEALLDRALSLTDVAITHDISMHELKVLAKEAMDRRSVINAQRQKDIQEVEAAFSSANELLSEMESCFTTVTTSMEGQYEDDSGMPSLEAEISALIRDADMCRELQNKIAAFQI
uniref:Sec2p domain-containing protein n=1 Tax=Ascaris lumbricoides TaxID=6252 RepID=A0A0M3HWF6_ASCLU